MITAHGKKRFTLDVPGFGIVRYGTCEEFDDDWRDIEFDGIGYFLVHYSAHYLKELSRITLGLDVLIANGFYDFEHDTFVFVKDFVWK